MGTVIIHERYFNKPAFATAKAVQCGIGCDAIYPGGEFGPPLELIQVFGYLGKHFLGQVFRFLRRYHAGQKTHQRRMKLLVNLTKLKLGRFTITIRYRVNPKTNRYQKQSQLSARL